MRLRLTNKNEPEENIKFESPEERSRITRSVDCIGKCFEKPAKGIISIYLVFIF